ncbi:DUF4190 domain-containing protein [Luteimonas sp. TWI1416]|uniref:DUF4190 domain-containing protein n=1 Tax=unclassified Luteimonas TaxID=2629088 RepID=UPI0032087431
MRRTSALAVTSLVCGLLGWSLLPWLGSLVAVITGHLARAEIRRTSELDGDGMAVAGLVLGYVQFVATVVGIVVLLLFFGGLFWLGTAT